jgi:glycosyltransferase involved in cell wall biosynthesis
MKICFVSYEISPTTKGGAGAFIANVIKHLLNKTDSNDEIILLLDITYEEYIRFEYHDKLQFHNSPNIRSYLVDDFCKDLPFGSECFASYQLWKSYRFDYAIQKLLSIENLDVIEFFDYTGIAYVSLNRKFIEKNMDKVHLTIRYHMSIFPIHNFLPIKPDLSMLISYGMESRSFELAERILFPSKVLYQDVIKKYHHIPSNIEVSISPPALTNKVSFVDESAPKKSILFFGYYGFLKGADLFLSAALLFLSKKKNDDVNFIFIGSDFQEPPSGFSNFSEYFQARLSFKQRDRFIFFGHASHNELSKILPEVRFAVIPSYIESFGYAAHELYDAGVPLIVRNIPVFTEYFKHEENALVFDGSVEDLAIQMERLWENDELIRKIKKPYDVLPPPLGEWYIKPAQKIQSPQKEMLQKLSLKILVLAEKWVDLSIPEFENCTVWQLVHEPNETNPPFPFLGALWYVYDQNGNRVSVNNWRCSDLMLVVTENDIIDELFITNSRRILEQNSEISFVACWKEINRGLKIYPTDAASETLVFEEAVPTRILYRTLRDRHFFDIFDNRVGVFSEIAYLWKLEEECGKGITIPEVLVHANDNGRFTKSFRFDTPEFNLLFMNASTQRQARLGHYFFTYNNSLSRFEVEQISQENARLKLAELDLKLLLMKLSIFPLGWIFRLRKNFRVLLKRYVEKE